MLPVKIVFIYLIPQMNFIMCGPEAPSNKYVREMQYEAFSPEIPYLKAIALNNSVVENEASRAKENSVVIKNVFSHFFKNSEVSLKQPAVQATSNKIRELKRFRRTLKTKELRCIHNIKDSKLYNFFKRCVRGKISETRQKVNLKKDAQSKRGIGLKAVQLIKSLNARSIPVSVLKDENNKNRIISISKKEINKNLEINLLHAENKLKNKEEERAAKNEMEDSKSGKINKNRLSNLDGKKTSDSGNIKTISNKGKNPSKSKIKNKKVNASFENEKSRTEIPSKSKKPFPAKVNKGKAGSSHKSAKNRTKTKTKSKKPKVNKVDSGFRNEKNRTKTKTKSKKPKVNKVDSGFRKEKNRTKISSKSKNRLPSKNSKPLKTHKSSQNNTKKLKPLRYKNKNKFKSSKIPKKNKSKNNYKMDSVKSSNLGKSNTNLERNIHALSSQQDKLMKHPVDLKSRNAKKNIQEIRKELPVTKKKKTVDSRNAKDNLNDYKIGSEFTGDSKPIIKTRAVVQERHPAKVLLRKERNNGNLLSEVKNFIVKHFAKKRDKELFNSMHRKQIRETHSLNKEKINKARLTSKSISHYSDGFSYEPAIPKAENDGINMLGKIKNYVEKNFHSGRLKRSLRHKRTNNEDFESTSNFHSENSEDFSDGGSESSDENGINTKLINRSDNASVGDARSMTMSEYDDIYDANFTDDIPKRNGEYVNVRDVDNYETPDTLEVSNELTTADADDGYQTDSYSSSNEDLSTESNTLETEITSKSYQDNLEATEVSSTSSSDFLELIDDRKTADLELENSKENIPTDEPGEERNSRNAKTLKSSNADEISSVSSGNIVPNSSAISSSEVTTSSVGNYISLTNKEVGDTSYNKTEPSTSVSIETYSIASENVTNSLFYSSSSESIQSDILTSTVPSSSSFSFQEFSNSFSPLPFSSYFENSSNGIETSSNKIFSTIIDNTQSNTLEAEMSSLSVLRLSSTSSADINEYNKENSYLSSVSQSVFSAYSVADEKTSLESTNLLSSTSTTTELLDPVSDKNQIASTTISLKVHRDVNDVKLANYDYVAPLKDEKLLYTSGISDKENTFTDMTERSHNITAREDKEGKFNDSDMRTGSDYEYETKEEDENMFEVSPSQSLGKVKVGDKFKINLNSKTTGSSRNFNEGMNKKGLDNHEGNEYDYEEITDLTIYNETTTIASVVTSESINSEGISVSPKIFVQDTKNSENLENRTYILVYSDANTLKFIEETSTSKTDHEKSKASMPSTKKNIILGDIEAVNEDKNEYISNQKKYLSKIKSNKGFINSGENGLKRTYLATDKYEESVDYTSASSFTETTMELIDETNLTENSTNILNTEIDYSEINLPYNKMNHDVETVQNYRDDYDYPQSTVQNLPKLASLKKNEELENVKGDTYRFGKNNSVDKVSNHIFSASSRYTDSLIETSSTDESPNYGESSTNSAFTSNEDYDENMEEAKTKEVTSKAYDQRPKNYFIKTSSFQYLSKKHQGSNLKLNSRKQQRDNLSEKDRSSSSAVAYSVTLQNAKIMPDETTTSISITPETFSKSTKSKNEVDSIDERSEKNYDEIDQEDHDIDGISKNNAENGVMQSSKNAFMENEEKGEKNSEDNEEKNLSSVEISSGYESFDSPTASDDSELAEEDSLDATENDYESESSTEISPNARHFSKMKPNKKEKRLVEHLHSLIQRLKHKRHDEFKKKNGKKARKVRSVRNAMPLIFDKINESQLSPAKESLIAVVCLGFISSVAVGLYRIFVNCYSKRKGSYEIVVMDHSKETFYNSVRDSIS